MTRSGSSPTIGALDKPLDEAGKRNWIVVGVKKDWKRVFPFEE
jgi:hypothetical protein